MIVLSHRGLWRAPEERNSVDALRRSVELGFGTETDVRDAGGRLVISHDPPQGGEPACSDLVTLFRGQGLPLAINVKADGLAPLLATMMMDADFPWFAFDMSAPEMVRYAKAGLPFFTRHSDVEPEPLMYEEARGVWLDAFRGEWFDRNLITRHLNVGKTVCVVSPELHGRPAEPLWQQLQGLDSENLMICTDRPEQAKVWFAR